MNTEWQEDYTVGDVRIDQQHKHLFSLAERFAGADAAMGESLVMELFRYTREHFSAEEAHMRQIGFPAALEHEALHESIISELGEVAKDGVKTEAKLQELRIFYAKWLTHHILKFDKRYFEFAQGAALVD